MYIGVTNRTGISVLRQYLDHVECEEVVPVVLRSDKGSEITMVAAARHKVQQGQDPDIAFTNRYRFGTSLSNQRNSNLQGPIAGNVPANQLCKLLNILKKILNF